MRAWDELTWPLLAYCNRIWAAYVAEEYPNAQVVGLDISDDQFPPGWTVPKNLSLEVCNILDPLPEKFKGSFDIVHVRLLAGGLDGVEVFRKAIDQFAQLLSMGIALCRTVEDDINDTPEPGGYLQWNEAHFPSWQPVDKDLAIDSSKMTRFAELLDQAMGGRLRVRMQEVRELVSQNVSFTDVSEHEPKILPWLLQWETNLTVGAFLEISQMLKKVFVNNAEKLALIDEARRDLDEHLKNKGLITYKTKVVIARKVEV